MVTSVSPVSIARASARTSAEDGVVSRRNANDQTLVSTKRLNGGDAPAEFPQLEAVVKREFGLRFVNSIADDHERMLADEEKWTRAHDLFDRIRTKNIEAVSKGRSDARSAVLFRGDMCEDSVQLDRHGRVVRRGLAVLDHSECPSVGSSPQDRGFARPGHRCGLTWCCSGRSSFLSGASTPRRKVMSRARHARRVCRDLAGGPLSYS